MSFIKSITYNLDTIDRVANVLLDTFQSKCVLFNGAMGSGKTTLITALLKAMGSKDQITSPTFSIVNEYKIPEDKVFHFDFYRVETVEEVYDFGIEDYLDSDHWIFLEWSDRISELIPEHHDTIDIMVLDNETRSLKLTINTILTETYAENNP